MSHHGKIQTEKFYFVKSPSECCLLFRTPLSYFLIELRKTTYWDHNIIRCHIWTLVKAFKGQRNSWFQVIRGWFSGFRTEFLRALTVLGNSSYKGMFIDSCYAHCQTEMQETWLRSDSPELEKTVRSCIF